jgi:hypothetical protein
MMRTDNFRYNFFSAGRHFVTLKHLFYSLALALLLFHSSTAQTPDAPLAKTSEEAEARKELERKALSLLEEVVSEAQLLKRAENRIHIQALAASLFWKRDEKRARALYREAMKGLGEVMSSIDNNDPQYHNLVQAPAQLRQEILQMISPHDPELALEFLRATRQQPPVQTDSAQKPSDNDLQMELSLASQIADKDPQMALRIAEESLAKGFSYSLSDVLAQLMNKDRAATFKLANVVIKKLQTENLLANQEATHVAASLLNVMSPLQEASNSAQGGETPGNLVHQATAAEAYQELLNLVVTTALSASLEYGPGGGGRAIAQTLVPVLEPLLPQIERLAQGRAPALRRKIADYKRTLDPQSKFYMEQQDLIANGTVEALVEAARTAPVEVRNNLYSQAAWKALGEGDTARARRIIEENVSNTFERKQLLANLDQQVFWQTINEGKLNEAREMLSRLPSNSERIGTLVQLATITASKGDKRSALQFLEEARSLVGSRAVNYDQLQAQLQVSRAYSALDAAQSFEILEAQVGQFNELLAAAEVLNGFEQEYFKEGELVPQASTLGNMVTQHIAELSLMASIDFDRSKAVAGRFQRHETRIMAGLSIAQGALNGRPEEDTNHGRPGRRSLNRWNKRVYAVRF